MLSDRSQCDADSVAPYSGKATYAQWPSLAHMRLALRGALSVVRLVLTDTKLMLDMLTFASIE